MTLQATNGAILRAPVGALGGAMRLQPVAPETLADVDIEVVLYVGQGVH